MPIFEKDFIYDSFANQKGKGMHLAIKRLEHFMRKVAPRRQLAGGNNNDFSERTAMQGYALKADIRHYFDTVDHQILLEIIRRKIKDEDLIGLINIILNNHKTNHIGKGMPLGNLTSQFFANVYLNELDKFVKHKLKVRYYLRYVDDFIILHKDKAVLNGLKVSIYGFLKSELKVELHPDKSRVIRLDSGVTMLGFRVFNHYRLLKKSNARRIWKRLKKLKDKLDNGEATMDYISKSMAGWSAYAKFANTYNFRKQVEARCTKLFCSNTSNGPSQ